VLRPFRCALVEVSATVGKDGTYFNVGATADGAKSGAAGEVVYDSRAPGEKDYQQEEGVLRVAMRVGTFTNAEDIYMGAQETISFPNEYVVSSLSECQLTQWR
jgi:hypothetical protein